jgi:hypothetical protein
MTGNDRVDRAAAPLVSHHVKIGMADAAEEDFDLNVVFG